MSDWVINKPFWGIAITLLIGNLKNKINDLYKVQPNNEKKAYLNN